jgi:4-alpha-glucanotransferase
MNDVQPSLNLVRIGRDICGDLGQAERREWWVTNGRGAYAAGTVACTLTRRYHGLLIAPLDPPLGRYLVFAKADETLVRGAETLPLHSNRWADGAIAPQGHVHVESFALDGRMPVWRFALGDCVVEKRIWLEHGANTVYVAYKLDALAPTAPAPQLRIKLLVNARDHHGNATAHGFEPAIEPEHPTASGFRRLRIVSPGTSAQAGEYVLGVQARGGTITPDRTWYYNFALPVERERGLPDVDHHLCVGEIALELRAGEWTGFCASLERDASPYLDEALRRARVRDAGALAALRVQIPELAEAPAWVRQLVLTADDFLFARPTPEVPDGQSVIAGYPWFGDWGRDTMIALPGLTLATGRHDAARAILETFARYVDGGMLPNLFPGAGTKAEYNTADAALWFVEAWRAYVAATGDEPALRRVFPVLQSIIDAHVEGTRYGIGLDADDGLLRAGEPGVQLTWMDARIDAWVVTPRIGKPVEINALWYNALESMAGFAGRLGLVCARHAALAERVRAGFGRYRREAGAGLYDVLDGPDGNDATIRPNQIFAVSLTHSPLDPATQAAVVAECGRELLCSYGLRSLARSHRDYRGHYGGGVVERDSAYHQGPIWAWLLGHYALAEYRVHGDHALARSRLEPIRDHLFDAGLGSVSEIFDGDAPHTPRGAPSQAWSVACILEAWWRLEGARRAATGAREVVDSALPLVANG